MKSIGELVVVEGKTDIARLGRLFAADFYATGGSAVDKRKIADIRALAGTRGVVLFLDNDHAGENIRRRLQEAFPLGKHAFVTEPWGKMGQVALASDQMLLAAMSVATKPSETRPALSWADYLFLNITPSQRKAACTRLALSSCNNKQFFKRANMIGLTLEELRRLCHAGF